MKNFKRIASLTLATTLCFSLAACGEKKEVTTTTPSTTTPSTVVDSTVNEAVKDTVDSIVEVGKEVGETAGTVVDSVVNGEAEETISLNTIFESIKEPFGENFLASMELDAETFNSIVGLDETMYSEFIAFQAPMSAHIDRFYAVKTEDTATVEAKFNEYKTSLVNDTMQYPSNIEKIAGAVVETRSDYVFFYILGGYPENVEDTENQEFMKKFVEDANLKVKTVLNEIF